MRIRSLRVICSLVTTVLFLSLFGCETPGSGGSDVSGSHSGQSLVVEKERLDKIASEPQEISILIGAYKPDEEDNLYTKVIKEFETTYNKKIRAVQTVGEQLWKEKIAAQIAAGDPVGVFLNTVDQYLVMYQKNYMMPINAYIDLSAKGHSLKVMDDYLKHDGQYYAGAVSATPYVMYYNRDILAANGFSADEPKDLYEKSQWTWDAFVEMARACTDADAGIVGLENMYDEAFMATNACSAVDFVDGKYTLLIKEAPMRHTLTLIQDIFKKNVICGSGYVTGQNKFLKGKAAMHGAYAYEEANFAKLKESGSISIDIGVAPFPYGPDNPDGRNFAHSTGFSICTGFNAPYSAGLLIDMIAQAAYEENIKKNESLPAYSRDLYNKLAENIFIPSLYDGILERGYGPFGLRTAVKKGEDINQKLAEFETKYQKMVDDANAMLN